MRPVIQRVTRAAVTVGPDVVGRLDEPGLCVFELVNDGPVTVIVELT
jgi:D-Tyr-tRNAtyr deacylase